MKKLDNKGSSMVEIVVGFALILIIIASFLQIINLSSNMTMESVDTQKKLAALQDEFYGGVNNTSESYGEDVTKFVINPIAGENNETIGAQSPIKLVECDVNGNKKTNKGASFNLSHAILYRIDSIDKELLDLTVFRMKYKEDPIIELPVTEDPALEIP